MTDELVEQVARAINARLTYALKCIANEDWKTMTPDDARREARKAVAHG